MRASKTPILLVSPVKSSIAYETMLRRNSFMNIARCSDAISALQHLETTPAHVIVSEVNMLDMDGFELTNNLREIEQTEGRYSYVILVTEQGAHNKVALSWQSKVDAIISRDVLPFRLIPQIMSGERIASQMNQLLARNRELSLRCDQLEAGQLLDPLTGLGNRRQAVKGLEDTIRQIEARGGAVCLLMISIRDLAQIEVKHNQEVANEMIVALSTKIRRLVRPLDTVTYFEKGLFAVIMQHNHLNDCVPESYHRIFNGVALKHYPTRAGYLNPKIAMSACGASAETGPPKIDVLVDTARVNLEESARSGEICVTALNKEVRRFASHSQVALA